MNTQNYTSGRMCRQAIAMVASASTALVCGFVQAAANGALPPLIGKVSQATVIPLRINVSDSAGRMHVWRITASQQSGMTTVQAADRQTGLTQNFSFRSGSVDDPLLLARGTMPSTRRPPLFAVRHGDFWRLFVWDPKRNGFVLVTLVGRGKKLPPLSYDPVTERGHKDSGWVVDRTGGNGSGTIDCFLPGKSGTSLTHVVHAEMGRRDEYWRTELTRPRDGLGPRVVFIEKDWTSFTCEAAQSLLSEHARPRHATPNANS